MERSEIFLGRPNISIAVLEVAHVQVCADTSHKLVACVPCSPIIYRTVDELAYSAVKVLIPRYYILLALLLLGRLLARSRRRHLLHLGGPFQTEFTAGARVV